VEEVPGVVSKAVESVLYCVSVKQTVRRVRVPLCSDPVKNSIPRWDSHHTILYESSFKVWNDTRRGLSKLQRPLLLFILKREREN
jgi:hypothetical protein